jgi:hypothetical protein
VASLFYFMTIAVSAPAMASRGKTSIPGGKLMIGAGQSATLKASTWSIPNGSGRGAQATREDT